MKRSTILRRAAVLAVALATLIFATAHAQAATPQRLISLSPGITEMLFALGLGPKLVGDTNYCDYPPEAKLKPHIGDAVVSYEAVVALKPDLIVADSLANEQAIPKLRALHLNVLAIQVRTLDEVDAAMLLISARTGAVAAARKFVADEHRREAKVHALAAKEQVHLRTLIIAGTDPLYVAGTKTFVGDMIVQAGGINAVSSSGFIPYSKEMAVAGDPQVIICGKDDLQSIKEDPAWSQTTAIKRGNVFVIDPDLIFRPGPRLILGLEKVESLLQNAHQP